VSPREGTRPPFVTREQIWQRTKIPAVLMPNAGTIRGSLPDIHQAFHQTDLLWGRESYCPIGVGQHDFSELGAIGNKVSQYGTGHLTGEGVCKVDNKSRRTFCGGCHPRECRVESLLLSVLVWHRLFASVAARAVFSLPPTCCHSATILITGP